MMSSSMMSCRENRTSCDATGTASSDELVTFSGHTLMFGARRRSLEDCMYRLRACFRLVLAAFASSAATPLALAQTAPAETPVASSGMDVAGMDRSVTPGDDFFMYANGTWVKTTEIPAD